MKESPKTLGMELFSFLQYNNGSWKQNLMRAVRMSYLPYGYEKLKNGFSLQTLII